MSHGYYTEDVSHMNTLGLESNISTLHAKDNLFYYNRGLDKSSATNPILVLIHGYPQSNFLWRHIIPLLPQSIPLFIPDIPGYGRSLPLDGPHDKLSQGTAILSNLLALLPSTDSQHPIILCGHDRGARIIHRLGVSASCFPAFDIRGLILLDIVPTLTQFQAFANPAVSAGSFHWPFLANVDLATRMILDMGGNEWVKTCLTRWLGSNQTSNDKFREHNAMDLYAFWFVEERVVRATCDDYRAGADEDVKLQESDQNEGRKLDINTLAVFSADYLGKRYDVENVWSKWMGKGKLEVVGVGEGCGHFIAEEKPEIAARAIVGFYEKQTKDLGNL